MSIDLDALNEVLREYIDSGGDPGVANQANAVLDELLKDHNSRIAIISLLDQACEKVDIDPEGLTVTGKIDFLVNRILETRKLFEEFHTEIRFQTARRGTGGNFTKANEIYDKFQHLRGS